MKQPSSSASARAISPGLRTYLYATAACTGAIIMVVEILGARVLAPYVGTSHFVWTAQIGVTLLALAAGYYTGGWLADRRPRLGLLYGGILLAAIYLSISTLLGEAVAEWCSQFSLAAGSLLASAILFFVPLALLAMVGPFFVRFLTGSVEETGVSVGRLIAVSTLGSVAGTILIGYVLIPLLSKPATMLLTSSVLIGLALAYFLARERKTVPVAAVGAAIGLGLGYAGLHGKPQFKHSTEVVRKNSHFGLLQVIYSDDGRSRFLLNDFLMQNVYDPVEKKSLLIFSYMLHGLARAYTTEIRDVLCIGMGVGIVPMEFARDGARVDVVEINPDVVPLAAEHFDFEPERMNIVIGDGRHFLHVATNRYDVVALDAFLGDSSPSHLMTREAFGEIRNLLRPDGTLVINTFGDFSAGRDFFMSALERTLLSVFRSVKIHHNYLEVGMHNVFFVASDQPELTLRGEPDLERVHPIWRTDVVATFRGLVHGNPSRGRVLTDDFNPVEYYDARNREQFRREVVEGANAL